MAGPNTTYHTPILSIMNRANTAPLTYALPEKASQTFKPGTPVQLATGVVQAWDGVTLSAGILGVSESFGLNLASAGLGQPGMPFGQIAAPGAIQTFGYVPFEASAYNIALGTPISDGRTLFIEANADNIFEAMFDNAAGTVSADYTPVQASIGLQYGLTVDTNGFWYVDKNKTGGSAAVQIVGINPVDGYVVNARVRFKFLPATTQVQY